MKIVYCTIAVHETYWKISQQLIESFTKYTKDSILLLMTDNELFYNQYKSDNIIIIEDQTMVTGVPSVNLNIKYRLLQIAHTYEPTHIVLFDCDSYFAKDMDNNLFKDLPEGISVVIGDNLPTSRIQNPTIKRKILAFDSNENKMWKMAREGTLLFTINSRFLSFCEEWGKLYQFVIDNRLTHTSEIFEINLASERSSYPINNLGIHSIREVLWMAERLGGGRTAIAPSLR